MVRLLRRGSPDADASAEQTGREVLSSFVDDMLKAEESRSSSIESRGQAVVSISGTLVTLLLALASLVTRGRGFVLPSSARNLLAAAVVAFAASVAAAVFSIVPRRSKTIDPTTFKDEAWNLWNTPATAPAELMATRLNLHRELYNLNARKVRALIVAVGGLVSAVVLLTTAALDILLSA